ncbi:MAG: hypothetical protein RLZZ400_57, partial [Actinomycetota bacterium]
NGVLMLGLGELVTVETLANHISELLKDSELRSRLHKRALEATAHRSNQQVVNRIISSVGLD